MIDNILFVLALICWAVAAFLTPAVPVRAQQLVVLGLIFAITGPPLVAAIR